MNVNVNSADDKWEQLQSLKDTDKSLYDDFIDGIRLFMISDENGQAVLDEIYDEIMGEKIW